MKHFEPYLSRTFKSTTNRCTFDRHTVEVQAHSPPILSLHSKHNSSKLLLINVPTSLKIRLNLNFCACLMMRAYFFSNRLQKKKKRRRREDPPWIFRCICVKNPLINGLSAHCEKNNTHFLPSQKDKSSYFVGKN